MKINTSFFLIFLVSCATTQQLNWNSDWNKLHGSKVVLKGILFQKKESPSYICSYVVTEDFIDCVELRNGRTNIDALLKLHNQCVIASGRLETDLPQGYRERQGIQAVLSDPVITSCSGL
jgi:hypothetical protein